jgi:hypothetical protein
MPIHNFRAERPLTWVSRSNFAEDRVNPQLLRQFQDFHPSDIDLRRDLLRLITWSFYIDPEKIPQIPKHHSFVIVVYKIYITMLFGFPVSRLLRRSLSYQEKACLSVYPCRQSVRADRETYSGRYFKLRQVPGYDAAFIEGLQDEIFAENEGLPIWFSQESRQPEVYDPDDVEPQQDWSRFIPGEYTEEQVIPVLPIYVGRHRR